MNLGMLQDKITKPQVEKQKEEMKREIRKFVEMNDTKTYEMSLRQCSEGNV